MMNNDANHFAVNETNTAAGPEDLGSDFDLAGAAERAAGNWMCVWRERSRCGVNAVPTTVARAGNESSRYRPDSLHHCPKKKGSVQLSLKTFRQKLLRKMLAGSRERDISRVKLAKMPAPTGFRGLPPAKKTSFTIRAQDSGQRDQQGVQNRTRKEGFLGQPADVSRRTDNLRTDLSSGCAILRVLHKEILAGTAEHTAAFSRDVCPSLFLPRQDEAVVVLETVAHRLQGVAGGGKLAIQRNSDAIPEDGDVRVPETSTTYTKSQTCLRQAIQESCILPLNHKAAGWAVMDADTRLGDWGGAWSQR